MRYLFIFLALLSNYPQPVSAVDPQLMPVEVVRAPAVSPAEAAVRVFYPPSSYGSGTVLASEDGKSLVVTNHHVVPTNIAGVVVIHKEKEYPARLLVTGNDDVDLSLLIVDVKLPAAPLATKLPKLGDKVRHWGSTSGPAEGKVTGATASLPTPSLDSTLSSIPGDSGAGVFDTDGKLVAVNWGRTAMPLDANQAGVPAFYVRKMVKENAATDFPRLVNRLNLETEDRFEIQASPPYKPKEETNPPPHGTPAYQYQLINGQWYLVRIR